MLIFSSIGYKIEIILLLSLIDPELMNSFIAKWIGAIPCQIVYSQLVYSQFVYSQFVY